MSTLVALNLVTLVISVFLFSTAFLATYNQNLSPKWSLASQVVESRPYIAAALVSSLVPAMTIANGGIMPFAVETLFAASNAGWPVSAAFGFSIWFSSSMVTFLFGITLAYCVVRDGYEKMVALLPKKFPLDSK